MPKIKTQLFRLLLIGLLPIVACTTPEPRKPNIILFYVDDLGFGDLGSYGGTSVATPFLDSLSKMGIRFTDAHSPAATCTPSRYSLLTGEYAFRNNAAILPGDAPLLIREGKPTLPALLK
ncbi:MAG: sulfatase-like hydrolase/transferase, partial [Flavihumibacter sp.]|nr:sulfatase-like hydrolase/transferase [Flavihumibacter sp.]